MSEGGTSSVLAELTPQSRQRQRPQAGPSWLCVCMDGAFLTLCLHRWGSGGIGLGGSMQGWVCPGPGITAEQAADTVLLRPRMRGALVIC